MCDGGNETSESAIAAVQAAAQRLRARGDRPADGRDIEAELVALRRAIDLCELEFAGLAHQLDESGYWDEQGSTDAENSIRHSCRMSSSAVRTALRVGEWAPQLPRSVDGVCAGTIGYAHLALVARTAARVARHAQGREVDFDDVPLLQLAEAHSVGRFSYDCDRYVHAVDEKGALQAHVDAVERRYLELSPYGEDTVGEDTVIVNGLLDRDGAATLRTALEPLARREGAEDHRYRSRRLADALVELCSHVLDQGSLPQRGSQRPHLQVSTTLETLRGLRGAPGGEVEFGGPVPAATVQRLACDSAVVRVVLDAESAVIDVGRARRTAPPATLRALRARDQGCVWPGCDRSAAWTTAHHVGEWVKHKGETDLPNMVLLCYRHHWRVHEGGWQVARTDEGVITVPPFGRYVVRGSGVPDSRPRRVRRDDWAELRPSMVMPCQPLSADPAPG